MKWRIHLIAFSIFVFAFGTLKLVWDNPKIILYFALLVIGALAYAGIYIAVKAKIAESKKDH